MDRPTFVATELAWRRLTGDVRVSRHPARGESRAYDYLTIERICSPAAAAEVGAQMLATALESKGVLFGSAREGESYVHFSVSVACDVEDGSVVDEVAAETTERMEGAAS